MAGLGDFKRIVLIADNAEIDNQVIDQYSLDLNRSRKKNADRLKAGLLKIIPEVVVYDDLQVFSSKAREHKEDLIFPYWNGKISRNKKGLVASICEVEDLYFVGGDAYSNIICGDKVVSKDVCRLAGVNYPPCYVIYEGDQEYEWEHGFPVLIKPIFEGSSMGITQKNIVYKPEDVLKVARVLIEQFGHPVIMEKFIPGEEVTVSLIGWGENIKAWSASERVHEDIPNFFDRHVFGFEEKIKEDPIRRIDARHKITEETLRGMSKIIQWLDKIDYIRIDGKIWEDKFWCFELSPDASMNPTGSFFGPFRYIGMDFEQSLRLIIESCLERYNNLHPSRR